MKYDAKISKINNKYLYLLILFYPIQYEPSRGHNC